MGCYCLRFGTIQRTANYPGYNPLIFQGFGALLQVSNEQSLV